jgi:hypothetical protein
MLGAVVLPMAGLHDFVFCARKPVNLKVDE